MSLMATAIRELIAMGVEGEALAAAIERLDNAAHAEKCRTLADAVAAATRAADAHLTPESSDDRRKRLARERQAKCQAKKVERENASENVSEREPSVNTDAAVSPETKSTPRPPIKTQPSSTPPLPPTGEFPPQSKAKPSRRCPASWEPNATTLRIGGAEGFAPGEIDRELSKMRAHEFRTARADWDAVAQNWLRESADRRPRKAHERSDPSTKRTAREDNFGRSLAAAVAVAGSRTNG